MERREGVRAIAHDGTSRTVLVTGLLLLLTQLLCTQSAASHVRVSMQITADNRYRIFLGDRSQVREIIATDWQSHWSGWQSVETHNFAASPGDYIYVVAQDDGGAAMLLSVVRFNDIVVYGGNWEVHKVYRQTYGETPPTLQEVNGWVAVDHQKVRVAWEEPAVGEIAGQFWSPFNVYRPARYIWKEPGGTPRPPQPHHDAWGFRGYTGPGTALFRIRVLGPPLASLKFELVDAQTNVSIPGVLLVLIADDGSERIAVETTSDGTAIVPLDAPRLGKRYSLQVFPRRYYRRGDGSVVTYLTPTAGSTGGGTDIAIEIAKDGSSATLIDEDTRYQWGRVYWRLTTGYSAGQRLAATRNLITLPIQMIPIQLERVTGVDVVQFSLDKLVQVVNSYNAIQTAKQTTRQVPPHIAYANCMVEIGGEAGLAYTIFQGEYYTTVNNRGEFPYFHLHYDELPNCSKEHTDSGFGHGQLSGLTALRMIQSSESWWSDLSRSLSFARAKTIEKLAELATPQANISAMLRYLDERFGKGLDRSYLEAWKSAIQAYYGGGGTDRLQKAWRWLTRTPRGTINWEIPIPTDRYESEWDASLRDTDFDGWLDSLLRLPPPAEVY